MRALLARFPALSRALPRVGLHVAETPVERWAVDGLTLLAKRDDLSAPILGGNKVRALELLLAGGKGREPVLTVGGFGSTHALSVALHAADLGALPEVILWPQEMNESARRTTERLRAVASVTEAWSPADAYLRAWWRRSTRRINWVPAGGSSPLGVLGHASAALELVEQCERDGIEMPGTIVLPLGTGGTAAGLLLGFSIAGVHTHVVGARVVPRVVANRRRVLGLARSAWRLLEGLTGEAIPRSGLTGFEVDGSAFAGAYGRELARARDAAARLRAKGGPSLDGTYSAKAFVVALDRARAAPAGSVLFWLTFDGRWLEGEAKTGAPLPGPDMR